uniref:Uncharacterized protein n=1 Tax=Aegilops tauschii subsp. strangulata TaxID=200361 RepID=A0A453MDU9_AEGTS
GGHHLVVYSLPGRKDFYPELVNMLGESGNPRCNVLFSRLDLLKAGADRWNIVCTEADFFRQGYVCLLLTVRVERMPD